MLRAEIKFMQWYPVSKAKLFSYGSQVLHDNSGGQITYCVRTYIFLKESH